MTQAHPLLPKGTQVVIGGSRVECHTSLVTCKDGCVDAVEKGSVLVRVIGLHSQHLFTCWEPLTHILNI